MPSQLSRNINKIAVYVPGAASKTQNFFVSGQQGSGFVALNWFFLQGNKTMTGAVCFLHPASFCSAAKQQIGDKQFSCTASKHNRRRDAGDISAIERDVRVSFAFQLQKGCRVGEQTRRRNARMSEEPMKQKAYSARVGLHIDEIKGHVDDVFENDRWTEVGGRSLEADV
jgi:hypothetical protein